MNKKRTLKIFFLYNPYNLFFIALFSKTLACTVRKDAPYNEIGTAIGTVLCETGDWEGGRCNRKKNFLKKFSSLPFARMRSSF